MQQRSFYTSGIRLFRIFGIEVYVHWMLLILLAYELHQIWVANIGFSRWHALGHLAVWSGGIFTTILLHEFGHCYAAYRMGGGADAVVLWPLGGLALCDAPRTPRAQFWVAAGGPLVNVALIAVFGPIKWFAPITSESPIWNFYVGSILYVLVDYQIFMVIFNLVPMWPLDGGRIFHSMVWARVQSYGRACLITLKVTWVSVGVMFFLCLFDFLPRLAVIFLIWCVVQAQNLKREALEGEQDYVFGYDFSRGYTSLDRTATPQQKKPAKPGFFERLRRKRLERARLAEAELRQRLDELLDKISREGMQSLTDRERRFLDEASRKLKSGKEREE